MEDRRGGHDDHQEQADRQERVTGETIAPAGSACTAYTAGSETSSSAAEPRARVATPGPIDMPITGWREMRTVVSPKAIAPRTRTGPAQ